MGRCRIRDTVRVVVRLELWLGERVRIDVGVGVVLGLGVCKGRDRSIIRGRFGKG